MQQGWIAQRGAEGDRSKKGPQEHLQEVPVIPPTNAITNPRAVMVHTEHTAAARAAVMGPFWP